MGEIWRRLCRFFIEYASVRPPTLPAALAFGAVSSVFPLAALILFIYNYLGTPYLSQEPVLNTIAALFPYVPSGRLVKTLTEIRFNLGWWGLGSLLGFAWSGSFFFGSLETAFNRIYAAPNRPFWYGKLLSTVLAMVFSALLLLVAAASVLVPTLRSAVTFFIGWWPLEDLVFWAGLLAAILLFGLTYLVVPNAHLNWGRVWLGTLVAAALFQGISYGFGLYLHYARFYRYGIFAFSLELLLWFYLLSEIILFGAYLNSYFLGDGGKGRLPRLSG